MRHITMPNLARILVLIMVLITMIPPGGSTTYTATVSWTASVGEDIISIALDETNSRIYVGTIDNKVLAYSFTGTQVWSSTLNTTIATGERVNFTVPAYGDMYIWTASNHTAYLINSATGAPVWNITNTSDTNPIIAMAAAKTVPFYAYASKERIYAFNSTGGLVGAYEPHAGAGYEWQDMTMDPDGDYIYGIMNGPATEVYKRASYTATTICTDYWDHWNFTFRSDTTEDVTDYQVVIDTTNQTIFELAGNDPMKIEVYDDDMVTPIPFFIMNWSTTEAGTLSAGKYNMRIWAKIPSFPAGAIRNVSVKVNPARTVSLSNENTTFRFYDEFNDATLNLTRYSIASAGAGGSYKFVNGILQVYTGATAAGYVIDSTKFGGMLKTVNTSVDFWNISYNPAQLAMFGISDQYGAVARHTTGDAITSYVYNPGGETLYNVENSGQTNQAGAESPDTGYWQIFFNNTYSHARLNGVIKRKLSTTMPTGSGMHLYYTGHTSSTIYLDRVFVRNYTVNGPAQITPTGYNSTSYTCSAWTPWDIFNYSVSKNVGPMHHGRMAIDSAGAWLGISNATHNVHQMVTAGSFSTMYTYNTSSGALTTKPPVSGSASFSIEGRGSGIIDVIRLDGTRVGTYTAGGIINEVGISNNGLYAIGGSSDGIDYIFSKATSSSWTLLYSSNPLSEILATAFSSDGVRAVSGRGSGVLTMYSIGQEAANYFTITVIKNAMPYIGAAITVEDGGVAGTSYTAFTTGTTDSLGTFSPKLDYGHYYRVTVGASESVKVFYTSSNLLNYYITIAGGLPTAIDYSVTYNSTTNDIWLYFQNSTTTDSATWTITRLEDGAQVASYTCTSVMMPTFMPWNIPPDFRNQTYMVTASVACGGGAATNTWMIYATNEAGGGGMGNLLPPGLDAGIKMGIGFILLLCIGGVFSYLSGPIGAFLTALSAGGLILMHVWPVDFFPTVVLCIVWAFLGVVGRAAPEV